MGRRGKLKGEMKQSPVTLASGLCLHCICARACVSNMLNTHVVDTEDAEYASSHLSAPKALRVYIGSGRYGYPSLAPTSYFFSWKARIFLSSLDVGHGI